MQTTAAQIEEGISMGIQGLPSFKLSTTPAAKSSLYCITSTLYVAGPGSVMHELGVHRYVCSLSVTISVTMRLKQRGFAAMSTEQLYTCVKAIVGTSFCDATHAGRRHTTFVTLGLAMQRR